MSRLNLQSRLIPIMPTEHIEKDTKDDDLSNKYKKISAWHLMMLWNGKVE